MVCGAREQKHSNSNVFNKLGRPISGCRDQMRKGTQNRVQKKSYKKNLH